VRTEREFDNDTVCDDFIPDGDSGLTFGELLHYAIDMGPTRFKDYINDYVIKLSTHHIMRKIVNTDKEVSKLLYEEFDAVLNEELSTIMYVKYKLVEPDNYTTARTTNFQNSNLIYFDYINTFNRYLNNRSPRTVVILYRYIYFLIHTENTS